MAYRTVGRHAGRGVASFFFVLVIVVLTVIVLAWTVHWAGCPSGTHQSLSSWRLMAAWRYLATRQAWAGCLA
jgi:hypothetical protein